MERVDVAHVVGDEARVPVGGGVGDGLHLRVGAPREEEGHRAVDVVVGDRLEEGAHPRVERRSRRLGSSMRLRKLSRGLAAGSGLEGRVGRGIHCGRVSRVDGERHDGEAHAGPGVPLRRLRAARRLGEAVRPAMSTRSREPGT